MGALPPAAWVSATTPLETPRIWSLSHSEGRIRHGTFKIWLAFVQDEIFGERRMRSPNHLREQARRCRGLSKTAVEPDLIEQLRVWSLELADEADTMERRAADGENHQTGPADLNHPATETSDFLRRQSRRTAGRQGLPRRLASKKRRARRGV